MEDIEDKLSSVQKTVRNELAGAEGHCGISLESSRIRSDILVLCDTSMSTRLFYALTMSYVTGMSTDSASGKHFLQTREFGFFTAVWLRR